MTQKKYCLLNTDYSLSLGAKMLKKLIGELCHCTVTIGLVINPGCCRRPSLISLSLQRMFGLVNAVKFSCNGSCRIPLPTLYIESTKNWSLNKTKTINYVDLIALKRLVMLAQKL